MGKKVLLGITGSIAAYKSAEIVRCLIGEGVDVTIVMTESAARFITPLTLRTLSKNRVYCSLFQDADSWEVKHVALAKKCDLLLIAPATANIIGKLAHGLADDLLSTAAVSVRSPIVIAPAMNDAMYSNPVVKDNLKLLRKRGYKIIEPEEGKLANGEIGKGRLADVKTIINEVKLLFRGVGGDFSGKTMVVSAGPTREPVDPVRFISNPSTGRMGYALAKAAEERGAKVILVTGPTHLTPPQNAKLICVETALEMRSAVVRNFRKSDVVVMAAAPANYRPMKKAPVKIKKGKGELALELKENPDILQELGRKKGGKILVGFSLETHNQIRRAKDKLREKNLDLIVVNNPLQDGAGFAVETNIVKIIDRKGNVREFPKLPKEKIAHLILDRVRKL